MFKDVQNHPNFVSLRCSWKFVAIFFMLFSFLLVSALIYTAGKDSKKKFFRQEEEVETKVEKLFGKLGGLEFEEGTIAADLPDRVSKAQTTVMYNRLKQLVNQYENYRTFDRRECLKRRVYLEVDYNKIPKDTLDKFAKEMERKFEKQIEVGIED